MTAVLPTDTPNTTGPNRSAERRRADRASRTWRQIWRMHFYAGVLSMPVLVMFAITGLVILYAGPIERTTHGDLLRATPTGQIFTLDDQRVAALGAVNGATINMVTPAPDRSSTTAFLVTAPDGRSLRVYVDPYTNKVTGTSEDGSGVVGLANRLHGFLNTDKVSVPLPMLSSLLGSGEPLFQPVPLTEIILEVFAGWLLALAVGGLYLWWPRKKGARPLLRIRMQQRGRARWRDLHAVPGVALAFVLVFLLLSGMAWSAYWGANWSYVANRITPNKEVAEPSSTVARFGDLDVFGNRIPWGSRQDGVPSSGAPSMPSMPGMDHGGGDPAPAPGGGAGAMPRQFGLTGIALVAADAGMRPGYSIAMPSDTRAKDGTTLYGTFVVTNPWPSRSQTSAHTLYVDQFSGKVRGQSGYADWGALNKATDMAVQTHMGTQFGLADRVVMTLACVLVLWSAVSGLVMWSKRRRKGTLGTPRRPTPTHLPVGLLVTFAVFTVVFPLWGASCWAVLALDRFVIQKVGPLRRTFGQRDTAVPATAAAPAAEGPAPD